MVHYDACWHKISGCIFITERASLMCLCIFMFAFVWKTIAELFDSSCIIFSIFSGSCCLIVLQLHYQHKDNNRSFITLYTVCASKLWPLHHCCSASYCRALTTHTVNWTSLQSTKSKSKSVTVHIFINSMEHEHKIFPCHFFAWSSVICSIWVQMCDYGSN